MNQYICMAFSCLVLFNSAAEHVTAVATFCPKYCQCDLSLDIVDCHSQQVNNFTALFMELPKNVKNVTIVDSKITIISGMHKNISKYPSLLSLSINKGILEIIKSGFLEKVPRLKTLNLSSNRLTTLEADVFLGLGRLEVLDLSYNELEILPKSAFMFLQGLKELRLNHNELFHIPVGIFNGLIKLEKLDLSFNKLNFIEKSILAPIESIRSVNLIENNIKSMTEDHVKNLTHIESLQLSSNPWDCSCALEWIAGSKIITDLGDMRCASPNSEATKSISEAKLHKCVKPVIRYISQSSTLRYHGGILLQCNATGYPKPSIYWVGPRGTILAHRLQRHWLEDESQDSVTFESHPVMFSSTADTLDEGDIVISNFRLYLSGTWTCIAVNPVGNVNMTTHVKIFSFIHDVHVSSLYFSAGCATVALILGLVIGFIRYGYLQCRENYYLNKMINENKKNESLVASRCASPKGGSNRNSLLGASSDEEYNFDGEDEDYNSTPNIKDALEDMGVRMRTNMKKNAETMRNRMSTLKESTSMVVQKLHSSSSTAATKVRTGVQMSVEQIKYQVQSMKELCGHGELCSNMPSTISVSTCAASQSRIDALDLITEEPGTENQDNSNNDAQEHQNDDDHDEALPSTPEAQTAAVPLLESKSDTGDVEDVEDDDEEPSKAAEEAPLTADC